MKPKIDLNTPISKIAFALYKKETKIAWEMEQTVEKAIIPIYYIPKRKAHEKPKTKPEQFGTGVLVRIKDQYFIFSATHVFHEFEGKAVLVGIGKNEPIEQIGGERFSTGNLKSNKIDLYDATVFHIQTNITEKLKKLAITLEDFDFKGYDSEIPVFMIAGYLAKESNTSGNQIKSKSKNFSTVEIKDYNEYGYDKESQIVLAFENQVLIDNQWKTSPKPKGMSGGAIIKAQGTSMNIDLKAQTRKPKRQLLSAITIEQHRDKGDKLGFLLGTRINVHLGLIYKFLELLEDLITE